MSDNIGQTGPGSLRINGQRIENLPIAEAAGAIPQLPNLLEDERQNKIEAIKARYPRVSVEYARAKIKEARGCQLQYKLLRQEVELRIGEYRVLVAQCEMRDTDLKNATDQQTVLEIRKKYPLYQIKALQTQITIDQENLKRYDDVIDREQESIIEFTEALTLVQRRDAELKALGA